MLLVNSSRLRRIVMDTFERQGKRSGKNFQKLVLLNHIWGASREYSVTAEEYVQILLLNFCPQSHQNKPFEFLSTSSGTALIREKQLVENSLQIVWTFLRKFVRDGGDDLLFETVEFGASGCLHWVRIVKLQLHHDYTVLSHLIVDDWPIFFDCTSFKQRLELDGNASNKVVYIRCKIDVVVDEVDPEDFCGQVAPELGRVFDLVTLGEAEVWLVSVHR